ncbi:hypothetical protein RHGRI_023946 [Rhododendron griersonianum]|uniref:Uncharacterized protein n=1 Tax=Rhododendron griersonianum TaxID=479676 RepID=A0AAV6J9W5_9ERIC|nr:hypothetical protein RHGRI_023946 [Rhododendron griersonianum]
MRDILVEKSLEVRVMIGSDGGSRLSKRQSMVSSFFQPEGHDTNDELQKRNLREELEERSADIFHQRTSPMVMIEIVEKEATFYWKELVEVTLELDNGSIFVCSIMQASNHIPPAGEETATNGDGGDNLFVRSLLTSSARNCRGVISRRAAAGVRPWRLKNKTETQSNGFELLKRLISKMTEKADANEIWYWGFPKWDDDVVFNSQACGESKTPKRFINDTIRSDFHQKFLQKYMK